MNKKSIIIVISVLLILFIGYIIAKRSVENALDDKNRRGIELYVTEVKYAYARAYLNKSGDVSVNIDDLNIKVNVDVKCEEKHIDSYGTVELKGCTVDNHKAKYSYINGKVEKE